MKKSLAIVWSGISWMWCAHYLQDEYDITIFEKNDYVWWHTHTHILEEEGKHVAVDTWFIVFNNETYPHLLELFAQLGVEKQKSNMWFAVWNKSIDLQYCGSGLTHLFAQKKNIFSLQFWRFLFEIQRFFTLANQDHTKLKDSTISVQQYCEDAWLSAYFIDNYLVPMSAAVWSTSHENMYEFPIGLLLPFFYNHGLLWVGKQFQRYSVQGGSNTYTKKIIEQGNFAIHLEEPVVSLKQESKWVSLKTSKNEYLFDRVILASHADTSLHIAHQLPVEKKSMLASFQYTKNIAVLHTDASIMPPEKKVWAAWTQITERDESWNHKASTVYWMNILQQLPVKKDYFVSINPFYEIDETKIIKTIHYDHPLFTRESFAKQERLYEINKESNILFCGSYFGNGFHEDGLVSALAVVDILRSKKTIE